MKLKGTITEFDPFARTGKIEDVNGKTHLIQPNSLRRTAKLNLGVHKLESVERPYSVGRGSNLGTL